MPRGHRSPLAGPVWLSLWVAAVPLAAARGPAAVVLLGPSGAGKSETGNTLSGGSNFLVSGGLESETLVPSAQVVDFEGRQWQIVETPGYFDTSRTPEELATALERFSEIVSDHIVTLAFVVPYGRFGDAHFRGWRLIRGAFGASALKYTALLFTGVGARTEEDVRNETGKLCAKTPPPMLCTVLDELGAAHGGDAMDRIVTFGRLEPERRARDRKQLFKVAADVEISAGGRGYDHGEFLRAQARRKLMVARITAITNEEDKRVLELLLANVESGAAADSDLMRRLEEAEGLGETQMVYLDFEDRQLGPFSQVGSGFRQPMPIPYVAMKGFESASGLGGELFIHTGTDSGVRLRNGDERTGELRTAPFLLGQGSIRCEATGGGGFIAICLADGGEDPGGCLERRIALRGSVLEAFEIGQEELLAFVGQAVYLRLVDDRQKNWGFIALDNLEYPVLVPSDNTTEAEGDASGNQSSATPPPLGVPTTSAPAAATTAPPPATGLPAAAAGNLSVLGTGGLVGVS
mmetsp:Transcript_142373/g.455013  ORF Transcript_142373/g.455013 Transcript_142373/m.455013 type:complete len:521 (+) Transcript_142373:69-1631(+)